MNAQQLIKYMDTNGVPYSLAGNRLKVMDVSQLPGSEQDKFDDRGFYMSDKVEAAEAALSNAATVQADADDTAKAARQSGEEAALDAAKAQTAAVREILPMGETEKEMTVVGFLNPTGDTAVPAHLESHEPKAPKVIKPEVEEPEEEAKANRLRGALPDGFPGKAAFEAAGYNTYAKVRAVRKSGTAVKGVGDATGAAVDEIFAEEEA